MKLEVSNLLLLATIHIYYIHISAGVEQFTFRQKLHDLVEYKRSIAMLREGLPRYNNIYSRTSREIAQSLHDSLYKEIIQDKPSVDIVILLDGSSAMGNECFGTAKRFIARLINLMPQAKFGNRSIKVALLRYSLSEDITLMFDFSWGNGKYRTMVRKAIRKTNFPSVGYENHGATALWWADAIFESSSRANNNETAKVLLYATNGHITDGDLVADGSGVTQVSNYLKAEGYKLFTIVPGSNVERSTINDIASSPKTDYIIPIEDTSAAEEILSNLRSILRGRS